MSQYLIIILIFINLILLKLINSKSFKFNKSLINLFITIQLFLIIWIFYNFYEISISNFFDSFVEKIRSIYFQFHSSILKKLKL